MRYAFVVEAGQVRKSASRWCHSVLNESALGKHLELSKNLNRMTKSLILMDFFSLPTVSFLKDFIPLLDIQYSWLCA